ncbi:MAG: vancomycin permeability regulator SanA [Myxococcota bacterium]|jgi:vancomycin permeability regulator SanA
MWSVGVVIAGIVCGWVGLASALDLYGTYAKPLGSWTAAVVPGAAVLPSGARSGALTRRVHAAVGLWHAGRVERLVLTGGVGRHGHAEAEVAAQLARDLGVPAGVLVLEDSSVDTLQNAAHTARLIGPVPIVVVSDTYHCFRCMRMFGKHFDTVAVLGTPPPPRAGVKLALREAASVVWHAMRGQL